MKGRCWTYHLKHPDVTILVEWTPVSMILEINHRTVWSPAVRVGRLYLSVLAVFEADMGLSAGITRMADDYIEFDADVFAAFVQRLAEYDSPAMHPVGQATAQPILAASIILLIRSPRGLPGGLEAFSTGLRRQIDTLATAMSQ